MKRLIHDAFPPGTPEERLVRLVRASPRFEPEPFAKPRVLARVILTPARRCGVLPRTFASMIVFGGTAMAAAAVGDHFWTAHLNALGGVDPSNAAESPGPPPRPSAVATAALAAEPTAQHAFAPAALGAPSISSGSVPADRVRSPGVTAGRNRSGPKASGVADTRGGALPDADREDPAQVLEAIRSLRANGNAALAAVYLDEYMREHPRGILVEDALALSIEAASARRDRRSAGDYAERYLRQYPAGRFRALAEDALGRPGQ